MWWNNYIRIPFEEKGRSEKGADCWGLFKLVYEKERGIILPDYLECYDTTADAEKLGEVIQNERKQKWQDVESGIEFDAIILRMRNRPMHVGIVTKPGFMLHCAEGVGVAHENYTNMRWQNRVIGFSRWVK